jgi:hypothetical protein
MSDGRRFDQALRALDKFIAEQQHDAKSPADTERPADPAAATTDAAQPR